MTVNANFDTLTATTLMNYRKTLEDNIFTSNPLFYWLKEKGNMKVDNSGGTKIVCPLMYGMNNTAKSYSGYDTIDIIPQDGISAAEYTWAQYAVGITISGEEEFKNSGEGRLINLLEAKIKQAELSLIDKFAEHLFAASPATNDINSIPKIVTADGYSAAGVGGIINTSGVNAWWANQYTSGTHTTAAFDKLIADVQLILLKCAKGNDRPDIGIFDQATYSGLEGLLVKTINFIPQLKNVKAAEIGYDNYIVKGCTIMYDENALPAASPIFLNTKYIQLVTGAGKDFVNTPFIKADNGDYKTCMILWYGNLVCSNRARQGTIVTVT
jgi:hypothetical protein